MIKNTITDAIIKNIQFEYMLNIAPSEIPAVDLITDSNTGVENGNSSIGIIISLFFECSVMLQIMLPNADRKRFAPRLKMNNSK